MPTRPRAGGRPERDFMTLSHLQAMLLFALIISVAFGYLSRRRPAERAQFIVWAFLIFLGVGIAVGWLMYPFSK